MRYASLKSVLLLFLSVHASMLPLTMPVIKDGRYYNSTTDTYSHIDFWRAMRFLSAKMLSLEAWKKCFFSSDQTEDPTVCMLPDVVQTIPPSKSVEPIITWIGHASFLIQIGDFNILTDPIFGDIKVGPLTLGKRVRKPGICFEDLPHIDAIVISHNHSDHTDTYSLMEIQKKYDPMIFVPVGNKKLFSSMGFTRVIESTWWQKNIIQKDHNRATFTFLPAYHWSIRFSLGSYRASLWGSWMISHNGKNIYFAGDTAYAGHFKEIAQEFPSIDMALMPIGPTDKNAEEGNRHGEYHVDAREAVDAFIDLNARVFIPMHCGTFGGKDHLQYPVLELSNYWQTKSLGSDKQLVIPTCGLQYALQNNTIVEYTASVA